MNILATQAKENLSKIKTLHSEREAIQKGDEKEHNRLKYDVYNPRIRKIEDELLEVLEELREKTEIATSQKTTEIESLYLPIDKVKRILEYLRLDTTRDLTISSDDIKPYDHYETRYKEDLGYYFDDSYLKIKLFILQNGKPVNKYSLIAVGNCLFFMVLELPYSYGVDANTSSRFALLSVVKDFPTIELAKEWLSTHKARLTHLRGDYDAVKKEYEETLANYRIEDFQDFVFVKCPCGSYYTTFEKDSFSIQYWDDAKCPRCDTPLAVKA